MTQPTQWDSRKGLNPAKFKNDAFGCLLVEIPAGACKKIMLENRLEAI
jgi:hypothetical protein